MKKPNLLNRVFGRVQKGTLPMIISPLKIRTVYPETRYTFNQFQAYLILVIGRDINKFNRYASSSLTLEQKKEVLDSVKLNDVVIVDPILN